MGDDDAPSPTAREKMRWFEEQIAFLERELEHHKDQIGDLWSELNGAKLEIARLARRLGEEVDEESE